MSCTVSQYHLRKYLNHHKHSVDRNVDFKGVDGEDLEANKEHVIKNGRKRDHFYRVANMSLNYVLQLFEKQNL